MSVAHLDYLKEKGMAWFNPSVGIVGFWREHEKLKEKLGGVDVWRHRDLKRAKEIYATSIVAKVFSVTELPTTDWWVHKPKTDPPDGVMGTILERDGIPKMHVREIEVVEHFEGDILDTIRQKLSRKRYEPNTALACFLSSKTDLYELEALAGVIQKEETSLDHIFLVFHGMLASELTTNLQDEDLAKSLAKISVVQLKPVYAVTTISLPEVIAGRRSGNEKDFFVFEGLGRRGMRAYSPETPPKLF